MNRLWTVLLALCCACALFAQQPGDTLRMVPGRVVMVDGERMAFPTIFLPDYTEPYLMASGTSGYHDSIVLLDANDVLFFEYWHPDTPTQVHRLYSVRLRKNDRKVAHYWGIMDIRTPYGFTVMAYPRYRLLPDGRQLPITLWGNRPFSRPRFFVLQYGREYYEAWPPPTDSPILLYLNRDDSGHGSESVDLNQIRDFEGGFDADDFFSIPDLEFGF